MVDKKNKQLNSEQNSDEDLSYIKYKPDYIGRQKSADGKAQTCFTKVLLVSEGQNLYLRMYPHLSS